MPFRRRATASIAACVLLAGPAVLWAAEAPPPATTRAASTAPTTAAAPTTTTAPAELPIPDANTFRAFDRPSDDGSAIIVEWAKPAKEPNGVSYVVEIARGEADFAAGKFKSIPVKKPTLKATNPKYFGFLASSNKTLYYLSVTPADHFPPEPTEKLTPARIDKLHQEGDLTSKQADRAKAALLTQQVEQGLVSAKRAASLPTEYAQWAKAAFLVRWFDEGSPTSEQVNKLLEEGTFTDPQAALARAMLARQQSESEDILGRAKRLVTDLKLEEDREQEANSVFGAETPEPRRAVRLMRGLIGDNVLSQQQAATAQEIVDDFQPEGKPALRLAGKLLEEKKLPDEQVAQLARMIRQSQEPDRILTKEDKAARKWFDRYRAYLSKTDQDEQKRRHQDVDGETYYVRLAATDGTRMAYAGRDGQPAVVSARARPDLLKSFRLNNLLFAVIFSAIVLAFIQAARRNPNLFIRKIAGLDAVEEAIGRATEMGRSVYFVHGLGTLSELATIAALNVLARLARRAAEYDTRLRVMNYEPIVTAISQEVVQQACIEAGRPDAFNADDVSLVANTQFSYVAAVSGLMVREQPAAVFLMGRFFAESLLLAETGASTGAIQVAGTDSYTQLPFFITTCDYTLIGEELYAASAYLSREPRLLGSLRGQDIGKVFLMAVIVLGAILLTLGPLLSRVGIDVGLFKDLFRAF